MNLKLEIQGDVALRPSALPQGATRIENRPLALGETSGHAHCIVSNEFNPTHELFEFEGKTFVCVGGDGAQMLHMKLDTGAKADHDPIILQANTVYEVILQNEFNPEADAFVRVID